MDNETLQLFVLGINYKTSTVSEREIFQINRKEISRSLNYFNSREEVEGTVIVSTCNRLEFYLVLKQNCNPFTVVNDFYFRKRNVEIKEKQNLFYTLSGVEVAKHLFTVITGLDSMLLGEYQVQGQIKEAYSLACSQKSADKILHKLFHAAFRVGKNIRSKTKIGSGKQSLSGVAFQIIKEKLKKEDVVTIVGVNQNTKIIAELLSNAGFSHLIFVNRTLYKAEELAEKYNSLAFSLDRIEEPLISAKCVFTCTGSAEYILSSKSINANYNKSHCPSLLIDMAVPRDINTDGINKDIEIIDLEGLKKYLEVQKTNIEADIPLAQKIILDEANIFEVWNESQQDNYLGVFAEKVESIRLQLLDETRHQVSEEEIKLLDKFSHSLLHRMKSTINQTMLMNDELQEK
ncbi:MAG: glutamyl-tRNA reductase [Ignavibacteriaceae bacterium]